MALHHILVVGGHRVVYIDAREENLTPSDARRLAGELADRAEEE